MVYFVFVTKNKGDFKLGILGISIMLLPVVSLQMDSLVHRVVSKVRYGRVLSAPDLFMITDIYFYALIGVLLAILFFLKKHSFRSNHLNAYYRCGFLYICFFNLTFIVAKLYHSYFSSSTDKVIFNKVPLLSLLSGNMVNLALGLALLALAMKWLGLGSLKLDIKGIRYLACFYFLFYGVSNLIFYSVRTLIRALNPTVITDTLSSNSPFSVLNMISAIVFVVVGVLLVRKSDLETADEEVSVIG